jgi:chaperonin GroEL
MSKQTLFANEARAALLRGVNAVADPVKVTLGPRGRSVLLDRHMQPLATRDGVTVAKETANLPNRFENMGALYAREVADAAVVEAGDGTTTATIILQAIFRGGVKLIDAGAEPLLLADGIEAAAAACAESVKKLSIEATPELVRQAAIISTHGDVDLGTMIAKATCKVGASGVLELQDSRDETTTIEHVEGFYFDRGWRTGNNRDVGEQKIVLKNPLILISERAIVANGLGQNGKIILGDGLGGILLPVIQERRPFLIIAEELVGDALNLFATCMGRGDLQGGAYVKLPGFGDQRAAAIEDLRIAIGCARVHSKTSTRQDDQLSSFTVKDLGWCEQAVISPMRTVLIGGGANKMEVDRRLKQLVTQSQEESNPFAKEQIDHRIARLAGGVAVLKVGGKSEPEMLEKKARAEDAIHACRGALQEGVVPGGGVALLHAFGLRMEDPDESDWAKGWNLLMTSICEPARQIIRNTGHKRADEIVDKLLKTDGPSDYGYDAREGRLCNLYGHGVVDPTKVVLTALRKAASIGALLLTSEVLVTDIPEPAQPMPMVPPAFRG